VSWSLVCSHMCVGLAWCLGAVAKVNGVRSHRRFPRVCSVVVQGGGTSRFSYSGHWMGSIFVCVVCFDNIHDFHGVRLNCGCIYLESFELHTVSAFVLACDNLVARFWRLLKEGLLLWQSIVVS
jgi:hypothetical protein